MRKSKCVLMALATTMLIPLYASAEEKSHEASAPVDDNVIAMQREALAKNTKDAGFGPQSPRDLDVIEGNNKLGFTAAPPFTEMNLCNIHFHMNAEHKGGEFTEYVGNGNGEGYRSGFKYSGKLSAEEMEPLAEEVCPSEHGGLNSGSTIEVHYVHSTAKIKPGPTLNSCLSESIKNPQLRVETQVYVLVNDKNALDFGSLTEHAEKDGLHQATHIPGDTGDSVEYDGSTTGPGYNETGSPFNVTWSVRPKVAKVNIATVGDWCKGNVFDENHAHGVRNLVKNPDLLSTIE